MNQKAPASNLALRVAPIALAVASAVLAPTAHAVLEVQCPGDDGSSANSVKGDAIVDNNNPAYASVLCYHLTASDSYINLPDETQPGGSRNLYIFSYNNLTGLTDPLDSTKPVDPPTEGQLRSRLPAPTVVGKEGQELYLTLSNVGLQLRPDLPDAHTIHYHGFPEASTVYDGVPDVSISPNSMASFTYYYNLMEPGSYIYHCHFEATEHMQMGMIGNLWVEPKQNEIPVGTALGSYVHQVGDKYVYNDGDGSTVYQREYPVQIIAFDGEFHDASEFIRALPFASMEDKYPMINGRGYPDTSNPDPIINQEGYDAQNLPTRITATSGEKVLLRLSNVSITSPYTMTAPGLTLELVGRGARIYRGAGGASLFQKTSQLTLAGGDVFDVIIDTTGVAPGTYFLYSTNLNALSNDKEDNGGLMTEIIIN